MPDRSALREELHFCKQHRDGLAKKIHDMRIEVNKVGARIEEIEMALSRIGQEPRVSDHALLRYFERKMGFDLEAIRQEILGNGTKEAIEMGAVRINKDGCHFLVSREGCITTVLDQNMKIPYRNGG